MTKYKLETSCRLDKEALDSIERVAQSMWERGGTKSEAHRLLLQYGGIVAFDDNLRKKVEEVLQNGKNKNNV